MTFLDFKRLQVAYFENNNLKMKKCVKFYIGNHFQLNSIIYIYMGVGVCVCVCRRNINSYT